MGPVWLVNDQDLQLRGYDMMVWRIFHPTNNIWGGWNFIDWMEDYFFWTRISYILFCVLCIYIYMYLAALDNVEGDTDLF